MSIFKSSLALLKIGESSAPEALQTVCGLETYDIIINQQTINASDVESGSWRQLQPFMGLQSVRVSGTGLYTNSTAEQLLISKSISGAHAYCQISFADNTKIGGSFAISQYRRIIDVDTEEICSFVLESAGAVTFG